MPVSHYTDQINTFKQTYLYGSLSFTIYPFVIIKKTHALNKFRYVSKANSITSYLLLEMLVRQKGRLKGG